MWSVGSGDMEAWGCLRCPVGGRNLYDGVVLLVQHGLGRRCRDTSCAWRPAWHSLACPVVTKCGVGGAAAFREGRAGFSIRYWGLLVRCEMSGRVVSKILSYLVVTFSSLDS